jgi:cytochrome c-type biogenesis protein CcmH/NrfF
LITPTRKFAHSRVRLIAGIALGVLILLGAGDDSARVEKLGHKVICMCGCSQVLLECNHYGCPYLTPEHQELVAAVDRGDSDSGILRAFVDKYGPMVLAAPTKHGFELIAWVLPYFVLALGIGGVMVVVRIWHKRGPLPQTSAGPSFNSSELDRFREQTRKETNL